MLFSGGVRSHVSGASPKCVIIVFSKIIVCVNKIKNAENVEKTEEAGYFTKTESIAYAEDAEAIEYKVWYEVSYCISMDHRVVNFCCGMFDLYREGARSFGKHTWSS